MGCASSKHRHGGRRKLLCRNCQTPAVAAAAARRSYSMHVHHHHDHNRNRNRNEKEEELGERLNNLSTLGSFKFDLSDQKSWSIEEDGEDSISRSPVGSPVVQKKKKEEFVMGMVEAKTWSKMIDRKIPQIVPKTPTRTPPGEPETINAWELMEGLEEQDEGDESKNVLGHKNHQFRSFSFNLGPSFVDYPRPKSESVKPLWAECVENDKGTIFADYPKPKVVSVENSEEEESNSGLNQTSIVLDFDPEVIASFRQALQELPPANPFHLKPLPTKDTELKTKKDRLILYFTSLRGVRKTYEDCCNARTVLKGLGVKIDERDVSMHSGFKDELRGLLLLEEGERFTLPKVFIGRRCIGGAEEIRKMHEEGSLEKAVDGCEVVDKGGGGGGGGVCEGCGDVRFVPCGTCYGSCKVYYEDDDVDEECEESNCGFKPCLDCNENGLIRCPICCD